MQHLNSFRQTEFELAEGFIAMSLDRRGVASAEHERGIAHLDQAMNAFAEQITLLGQSEATTRQFAQHLNTFRRQVDSLSDASIDDQTWARLYTSYNHLQSHARELDDNTLVTINQNARQLEGIFNWTLLFSVILFAGLGFGVYRAERERFDAGLRERESAQLLRLFVQHAPAAMAMVDRDMRYLLVSQRWAQDYQLQDTDLIGRSHYDIFPDMPERWKEVHQRCLNGAIESQAADQFPRADGHTDWLRWEVRPWHQTDGNIGGILILTELINDQIQAQLQLEEQVKERTAELARGKANVEAILHHSPDAILLLDNDLRIQQANDRCRTLFGYPEGACAGKPLSTLLSAEKIESLMSAIRDQSGRRADMPFEWPAVRQDGSLFDAELNVGVIEGEGLVCVIRDISERKAQERQLLFAASVQANMTDAVIVTDLELKIQSWNRAAETMYGWSAIEAIGQDARKVLQTQYESEQARQRDLEDFFRQGWARQDVIQKHRQKGPVHVRSSVTLLKDDSGEPIGVVAVNHDISERKQAELQLRQREIWYRILVQNLPQTSVFLFDQAYRYLLVEGPDVAYSPAVMEGKTVHELFPPEVLPLILPGYEAALRGERSTIKRESAGRLFEGQFVPIADADGSIAHGVLVVRDVTDEQQAADKLRASEERFRHAILNAPFPIMIHAEDGEILNISNSWTEISGYTLDEIPTIAAWTEKAYGARSDNVKAIINSIYERADLYKGGEFRVRTKAGDIRIWDFSAAPMGSLPDGRRLVSSMAMDVTERKAIEEALSQSEQMLHSVLENIPVRLFWKDRNSIYQGCNRLHAASIQLASPAEIVGKTDADFVPERAAEWAKDDQEVMATGVARLNVEEQVTEMDGQQYWLRSNKVALKNVDDEVIGVLVTIEDVTERKEAQEALRLSEAKFRRLINAAPMAIVVTEQDGRIDIVNVKAEAIFGYTRDELIGQSVEILVPEAYRERHSNYHSDNTALQKRLKAAGLDLFARRKDGTVFQAEIQLSTVETADSFAVMSFITDITEQKRVEAELERQRVFLREVIDQSPTMIFVKDIDGRFIFVNPAMAELFDTTVAALLQMSDTDLSIPPNEIAGFHSADYSVITKRQRISNEESLTLATGEVRWLKTTKVPLTSADGQSVHALGISTDITEIKEAEIALRESEEKYRHLVETMNGGLIIADTEGKFTYVNDRLCEILGREREEIIGKRAIDFVAEENQEIFVEALRIRQAGGSSSYEIIVNRKDNTPVDLLVSGSALSDRNGNFTGTYSIVMDITTRKQAEKALQQALATEKELGELKTRFVSTASHEFRTPLATILAVTETLSIYRHKLSDDKINQRLQKIKEQVAHLEDIIDDILTLARLQARNMEFKPHRLNLATLCRSVLDEFQSRADVSQQIEYEIVNDIPDLMLDRKLMRQVINNLVSNAVKYSAGATTVHVRINYHDDELILTVQDEGIGIPKADFKHLFQPFHRAANAETIPGTGLGLVIVKEAVELHGGSVEVVSKVGVGTTFTIRVPAGAVS